MQELFEISLTWGDRALLDIFANFSKINGRTGLKKIMPQ
jgi:hypothetical protein